MAISAGGFAAGGIIDFGGFSVIPEVTVALPLGAVCFGLSIISLMMEREMAKFDVEEAKKIEPFLRKESAGSKSKNRENIKFETASKPVSATAA
jgi:hypothetical protein